MSTHRLYKNRPWFQVEAFGGRYGHYQAGTDSSAPAGRRPTPPEIPQQAWINDPAKRGDPTPHISWRHDRLTGLETFHRAKGCPWRPPAPRFRPVFSHWGRRSSARDTEPLRCGGRCVLESDPASGPVFHGQRSRENAHVRTRSGPSSRATGSAEAAAARGGRDNGPIPAGAVGGLPCTATSRLPAARRSAAAAQGVRPDAGGGRGPGRLHARLDAARQLSGTLRASVAGRPCSGPFDVPSVAAPSSRIGCSVR